MKLKAAIEALSSLAQESRLGIFRLLVREGPSGLSAGAIGERLDIPAPTLSFHLARLSRAGLVTARRSGRSIIYGADYDGMRALLAYMTEECCQGRPEVCGIPVCAPEATGKTAPRREAAHEAPARIRRR